MTDDEKGCTDPQCEGCGPADDGRRYNSTNLYPTAGGLYAAAFGLCDHGIEPGGHDDVERAAVAHMLACPPDQPVRVVAG
jgi:hypothetical protein